MVYHVKGRGEVKVGHKQVLLEVCSIFYDVYHVVQSLMGASLSSEAMLCWAEDVFGFSIAGDD